MDEFTRDEQERMEGIRSHWDILLANELGIPTVRKSWKTNDRVVVEDPNAGRQKTKLDMVPLAEYSDTVLPQWKIDIIHEQNKPITKAQSLSNDIEAENFSYKTSSSKSPTTKQ